MRTLPVLLLLAAAAACAEPREPTAAASAGAGPDAILLRVPAAGGTAVAYRAGSDSVLWQSREPAPATRDLIAFDEFQGLALGAATDGRIFGLDLRLGAVTVLGSERLRGRVRTEGATAFGFDAAGRVLRLTPVATWSWTPPGGADDLVPGASGALLVLSDAKGRTMVRRIIPPEPRVLDSVALPRVRQALRTALGDRVWLDTDSGVIALHSRELTRALQLRVRDSIVAMAATPSGDRLFVATGRDRVRIIDRFAGKERGRVDLPQPVTALHMDPDGRYLLARPETGDSVFVISIGTARVIASLVGEWRDDLPLVTPDGGVLLARGRDVVLVDAESGRDRMRYAGGAASRWTLVRWNGFRPRAAGLDRPVQFEEFAADSAATDSALAALMAARYGDITAAPRADAPAPVSPAAPPAPEEERARPERGTWTVSFATLLQEDRATEMAARIKVDGRTARVVSAMRDGVPIWRVVLGPFDSREDAERAGMSSKLPYWVFEGVP